MKKRLLLFIFLGAFSVYLVGYLYFATRANLDLIDGRHVLFMDEHISYDGVKTILHPLSLSLFFESVITGIPNDQRYGRIFWNISALFSLLPEKLAGDAGQIVATRMVHLAIQLAAFALLVLTFLKHTYTRVLCLSLLLALPYTSYYNSMPKPEPIQLLFITLFLRGVTLRGFRFAPVWFFLGIAFGAKISTLPLLALMAFLSSLCKEDGSPIRIHAQEYVRYLGFFLLGWFLAIPNLLLGKFARYFRETFKNTTHGSDDSSINIFSWLEFILKTYFAENAIVKVASLIVLACSVAAMSIHLKKDKKNLKTLFERGYLLPIASGLSLLVPILLFTKRLWGFYTHLGIVLILVGLFGFWEAYLPTILARRARVGAAAALVVVSLMVTSSFALRAEARYKELAQRTSSERHKTKLIEYQEIEDLLLAISRERGRRITAVLDPRLYAPASTENYEIHLFWGPLLRWHEGFDVIIFYQYRLEEAETAPKTNIEYEQHQEALRQYKYFVSPSDGRCGGKVCYKELPSRISGLRIFEKDVAL